MENHDEEPKKKLTLTQVMFSTVAAAFGVQSSKNRERDFSSGDPIVFILSGIIFTLAFVLLVVGIVHLVI